jgi:hypothetical protein
MGRTRSDARAQAGHNASHLTMPSISQEAITTPPAGEGKRGLRAAQLSTTVMAPLATRLQVHPASPTKTSSRTAGPPAQVTGAGKWLTSPISATTTAAAPAAPARSRTVAAPPDRAGDRRGSRRSPHRACRSPRSASRSSGAASRPCQRRAGAASARRPRRAEGAEQDGNNSPQDLPIRGGRY